MIRVNDGVDATLEIVQHNIDTLMQIGGVYDFIAAELESRHADKLAIWRLDHKAKSVVDWLQDRQTPIHTKDN